MAKRKKPEFSTPEEEKIWNMLNEISNISPKNEKNIWARKREKIEKLVEDITPIETEILLLTKKRQDIYDEITVLRNLMVKECVHPFDLLLYKDNYVLCKFCNIKIKKNN